MSQIPPVISLDGPTFSSPMEFNSIEETNQKPFISSSSALPAGVHQQQNGLSSNNSSDLSGTIDSSHQKVFTNQTAVGNVPSNEMTMIMVTSPSFNDELSLEQSNYLLNESSDQVNLSSLSFLQSKQRQINHRRNKSEPVILANLDELSSRNKAAILESSSTSTTSNESAISHNTSFEKKSKKTSPATHPKQSTNGNSSQLSERVSSVSTNNKKKKPWYNPFQSTYRQRNEEFKKIFKDLPVDERLIVDYSCAWQKEILIQGRMYISQHHLCFHANFLKWETSLSLRFDEIEAITKEKTAKVIPNAIEVRSNKKDKYFFASFATRDKSYAMINRVWKGNSLHQSISTQEMCAMIRESYGNDVDMITDEEDLSHKLSTTSTPEKRSPQQPIKNNKYDRVTPNSVRSICSKKEETDDRSSVSSRGERPTDDDDDLGVIPIGEEANTNTLIRQPPNDERSSTMFERNYLTSCSCQSHLATKLIDRTYPISVERLFDYIFNDREFLAAYHASRRIKEFQASEWNVNTETGKRERLCTYKVDVTAVFGATTICSNEKQMIDYELVNSHYIIDTEVRNEGIKYADTFFVASRYCLVQIGPNKSHLKVTCEVRYVKSVMMIIKSFIEKNAMAALQDSFTDLMKRIEQESSYRTRSSSIPKHQDKEKNNSATGNTKKKHPRKQPSNELDSSIDESSLSQLRKNEPILPNPNSFWSTNRIFLPFLMITMFILLTVNIFLYLKLNQIDRMTDHLVQNYPLWSTAYTSPQQDNDWSLLLKRQEEYYQTKLNGLHSVLISTHDALKNVTDALDQLSKLSSGSKISSSSNPFHTS